MNYLVLTIIGDDRPGLVEKLSRIIVSHDGNWLESSMSQLAGKFAGILRVNVAEENADSLIQALQTLSDTLKIVVEKSAYEPVKTQRSLSMSLVGNDRPGIISEISRALASHGVNVEELNTECEPAPMSGELLFRATAELKVPEGLDTEKLQAELERIADDLIVDIQLARGNPGQISEVS
ncbi:MAG: ACT domain-containing protein [Pseudohongiellaceae bacterium]